MAWTTPATAVAGTVLTAAWLNTYVRDNTAYLYLSSPRAAEYDNGNSGTTKTIDWATNGPLQKVTRTGNCTYTLTAPSVPSTLVLKFIHETGTSTAYTVTYSPTVKNPSGTAFSFTNTTAAIDIVTFYWDGTSYYVVGQANFS